MIASALRRTLDEADDVLVLHSPMASLASDIYRRYPGYYDDETCHPGER